MITTTRRSIGLAGLSAAALLPARGAHAQQAEIVWWAPNWGQARAEELARRFEAANPGSRVRIEVTVSDGLQNRVLAALRSSAAPELLEIQNGWNIPFAATGGLRPLDDMFARPELPAADFVQAALNLARHDGRTYGIPYRVEAHAVYYNKAAFREAGLDPDKPPATWPDFTSAARALTRTTGGRQQFGFGITGGGEFGNTVFRSLPFIMMNGGHILSDDLRRVIVNERPAVEAVDFYASFLRDRLAPPSTLQNDGIAVRRLFIAGTVAMYQSGQFDLATIKREAPQIEIGVMPIPAPVGRTTAALLGGWNFAVPARARNTAGALRLLSFLAEPANMGFYTDTFPARTSAMDLPRFRDPDLAGFAAMLPYARPAPPHRNWVQITQIYFNGVQRVLLGEATAQKAMDDAAAEMRGLLD
jgi:multiple sugar transport system substrate-binding protein